MQDEIAPQMELTVLITKPREIDSYVKQQIPVLAEYNKSTCQADFAC